MLLRMNEWTRIDDPREYGPAVVNDLRNLLTAGGCARRDPCRENFYELECGGHTSLEAAFKRYLRGDASDATTWLGGEQCALYDDLLWARSVQKAFKNGIDTVIANIQAHCDEIAALPDFGVTGKLLADTAQARAVTMALKANLPRTILRAIATDVVAEVAA